MSEDLPKRNLSLALQRGLRRRCPNCGEGDLLSGYLSVNERCPSCREDFTPQRADDGPAWATMILSGHLVAPVLILIYELGDPAPWLVALVVSAVFIIVALMLLPRMKCLFISLQWANYMHGFDPRHKTRVKNRAGFEEDETHAAAFPSE